MTYCYACGHTTAGEPLFCNFCGRSYDAKLCPRLHVNPRFAEVCSRCGSRDLSSPQPKVPVWWRLFALLIQLSSGVSLAYPSFAVLLAFLRDLAASSRVYDRTSVLAFLLAILWSLWAMLPDWFRRATRRFILRRK